MSEGKVYTEFVGLKVTKAELEKLKKLAVQEGFTKGNGEPNTSAMLRELIKRTPLSAEPQQKSRT
jgi:hypothetical protein